MRRNFKGHWGDSSKSIITYMTQQHHQITLDELVEGYQRGCFTAKGALEYWVKIRLAVGWETTIKPKELMTLFGMAKSTFWGAIAKLKEDEVIDWNEPKKLKLKRLPSKKNHVPNSEPLSEIMNPVRNNGQLSEIMDSYPKNRTAVRNSEPLSEIMDNQPPQPLYGGESSTLSDSSSDLYSNSYSDSLSDTEREKKENRDFFNSQEQVVKEAILLVGHQYYIPRLTQTPALTDKWIECNAIEIYQSPYCPVEFSKITSGKYSENFAEEELLKSMIQSKIIAGLTPTKVIDLDGTTKPVRKFIQEAMV